MADKRKVWRATKEIIVEIDGEKYDALLIPQKNFSEVDFTQFPEDDPLRRHRNMEALMLVDLEPVHLQAAGGDVVRLTRAGAGHLLGSL